MTEQNKLVEKASAFSKAFWTKDGKTVQQKPQNPIAAKQAMYNKDPREGKVSLAQGMVFNNKDRTRVYDPKNNAWYNSEEEAKKSGCDLEACEIFTNKEGKIFSSPTVLVAEKKALERFFEEQFDPSSALNPAAYGTPTGADILKAIEFDGDDIYGQGKYDKQKTISFQTVGMASGYKHLTLPFINSARTSLGLPPIDTIVMGSNFYGAYPATFDGQKILRYRYMDENGDFDLKSFQKAADMVSSQTALFLFDMSTGNNFIGIKRNQNDNENIAQVLIDKQFYSEHDIAYPNFDPQFDLDSELFRILQRAGAPHGVQSSRGKKDRYASRLAFHHVYMGQEDNRSEILSHLVTENRNTFLAMPKTWGYLVELAQDTSLRQAHKHDEETFVDIVYASRMGLADKLGWDWMKRRSGMFDMVEMTHRGIEKMGEEYAIYAVPARNQNVLGKDGLPVEVARIKHGIPESLVQNVADALLSIEKEFPSEKGKTNPDIITAS